MANASKPPLLLDIVEEHFEELDFLWEQRESVIFAPDWNLKELAAHEERAVAHLEGLRLGGEQAAAIVRPALAGEEKGAATAAAMTLMALGAPDLQAEVVEALAAAADDARDGIRIGLRHSDISRVLPKLQQLASEGELAVRVAALDILAFHRQPPPRGLPELVFEASPEIKPQLNAALGRFGGPWDVDQLQRALAGGSPDIQRSALETSARLGIAGLAPICRQVATRSDSPSQTALHFLGVLGDEQDLSLLQSTLGNPDLAAAALAGLGALGRTAAIPLLIEAMAQEALTLAAGAAFTRITGATDIKADQPLPPPEGLSEEELDFHDPLVPADPAKARGWWEKEKSRFSEETRWQAGVKVSHSPLAGAIDDLTLEARRDVFLGERARDPVQTSDLELEKRVSLQLASWQER